MEIIPIPLVITCLNCEVIKMFPTLKQKYYKLGDQQALERAKRLIESNPELKAQYTQLCEEIWQEIGEYKKYATEEQLKDIETALIFLDKDKG